MKGECDTLVLSGFVRAKGFGDSSINKLMHKHGLISFAK